MLEGPEGALRREGPSGRDRRRVVLLGGSFDPIHRGHMAVAQAALAAGYDEVVLLPVALSPHKLDRPPAPAIDRWTMCVLATLPEPRLLVSRHEMDKGPPSYSVDTAQEFRRMRPGDDFWWAIGADNLAALNTWMRVDEFVRTARFLVVPRGSLQGAALGEAIGRLPAWLAQSLDVLDMPPVEASSTEIRRRARDGRDLAKLVPSDVAAYIARYGLYHFT